NRPLPPGPIPVNGPVLQRLQDGGRPGARTDQPGPGPELKERFLAAMAEEDRAFEKLDDSRLPQFFTGEALADLQRQMEREKSDKDGITDRVSRTHLVMQFLPKSDGGYQVVNALTERIDRIQRLPDGKYGQVVREGRGQRLCFSWLSVQESGMWKFSQVDRLDGGVDGALCPPGWS
ncbi:MAG: hypothetical protein IT340_23725, partial [Chloroflexi bacterium]|nr:hypothetical protein [Chloroflexota bacterium]